MGAVHRAPARSTCTTPRTARSSASHPRGHRRRRRQGRQGRPRRLRRLVAATAPRSGPSSAPASPRASAARMDEIATVVTREAGMPKWLSRIVQAGLPINSFNTAAELAEIVPVRGDRRQQPRRARSRSASSGASRRGTTRCTRSPRRSPTPWPPVAPSSSSRARSRRSTPSSSPRSSTTSACPPGVFNLVPAPGPTSVRRSPPTPRSTWCRSRARPAPASGSPRSPRRPLKRVALELGGKSANILLDDLDDAGFEKAVRDGVGKAYLNSGPDLHRAHPHARAQRAAWPTPSASPPTRSRPTTSPSDPFADGAASARCPRRPRSSG